MDSQSPSPPGVLQAWSGSVHKLFQLGEWLPKSTGLVQRCNSMVALTSELGGCSKGYGSKL